MEKFNAKLFFVFIILLNLGLLKGYSQEKDEHGELINQSKTYKDSDFFKKHFQYVPLSFEDERIIVDPHVLLEAAKDSLNYFNSSLKKNSSITQPEIFSRQIVNANQIKKTLEFIIKVIEKDETTNNFRILDSSFINKNFKFVRWLGNEGFDGKCNKYIRFTQYAVFREKGGYKKTEDYSHALYAINDSSFKDSLRFKLSKQDVLAGVLDKNPYKDKVKPLVWITRSGLEKALMQGSIIVQMPDNSERIFNVDKSNGMSYLRWTNDVDRQKRYWYFKEIKNSEAGDSHLKIINRPGVIFAGDLYSIGLGKIIALKYKNPKTRKFEVQLGILADTGAVLQSNFHHLDYFVGVFDNRQQFKDHIKKYPFFAQAYILVKK